MFNQVKCVINIILVLCFIQTSSAVENSVPEVIQSFSVIIKNMYEEIANFSTETYKLSSARVDQVLKNNSAEMARTMDLLPHMHKEMNNVITEFGMTYYPQMILECRDEFDRKKQLVRKTIAETENVCLIFISSIFQLIENPVLYKNISNARAMVNEAEMICGNKTTGREAQECFSNEIYSTVKPRVKEIKGYIHHFLFDVHENANSLMGVLHTCYDTVRKDVLIKKVRNVVRNFRKCVANKST